MRKKYEAIMAVERDVKAEKKIAEDLSFRFQLYQHVLKRVMKLHPVLHTHFSSILIFLPGKMSIYSKNLLF
jgi:hypothetical protein